MKHPDPTFSLTELAQLGGVTPRTVRYYIGQGLLPSPIAEGPNTRYSPAHVDRLQLIRELQREHLPLAEIRSRLERLGDVQVRDLLAAGEAIPEPRGTAFDYIQSVLAGTNRRAFALPLPKPRSSAAQDAAAPSSPPEARALASVVSDASPMEIEALASPSPTRLQAPRARTRSSVTSSPQTPSANTPLAAAPPAESPALDRSQWDRVALAPDVELHIRRPLSRLQNRRVERLLAIARHVLEEDQP